MKYLAVFLTLVAYLRHDTSYWVGEWLGISPKAAFYVLGGIQETILWALLAGFILMLRNQIWRSLALGACVIGMVEGLMIPVCRLALRGPHTGNTCDYLTGLPIGGVFVAVYTLLVCLFLARRKLT